MSVTVIGNTKYNETQQHVLAVGSGNDLSDNVYNTVVFGDNNELYNAGESITIMANDAVITDSNFVALIQPSGSRIISGSSNNVFVNPINDITETDPTGSVYTGNLINQGTADFKDGAKMTGSVDITGSLTLNGQPITPGGGSGGTGSAVLFNFAFGGDPTATTFVTIPNAIGSNRTFALEYTLTSGSISINSGQTQVTGDGSAAGVDVITQRNIGGAPTASFQAAYVATSIEVKATFIGSNYIISGSYIPLIDLYSGGGTSGTTIDTGSLVTTSSFNAFTSSINAYTSSLNAVTASFATTGSNTFIGNQTITGSLSVTGSINFIGLGNFVDDTAAAAGGVAIGQIYRNGNFIVIRIS